jgi:hypothetical protein
VDGGDDDCLQPGGRGKGDPRALAVVISAGKVVVAVGRLWRFGESELRIPSASIRSICESVTRVWYVAATNSVRATRSALPESARPCAGLPRARRPEPICRVACRARFTSRRAGFRSESIDTTTARSKAPAHASLTSCTARLTSKLFSSVAYTPNSGSAS